MTLPSEKTAHSVPLLFFEASLTGTRGVHTLPSGSRALEPNVQTGHARFRNILASDIAGTDDVEPFHLPEEVVELPLLANARNIVHTGKGRCGELLGLLVLPRLP